MENTEIGYDEELHKKSTFWLKTLTNLRDEYAENVVGYTEVIDSTETEPEYTFEAISKYITHETNQNEIDKLYHQYHKIMDYPEESKEDFIHFADRTLHIKTSAAEYLEQNGLQIPLYRKHIKWGKKLNELQDTYIGYMRELDNNIQKICTKGLKPKDIDKMKITEKTFKNNFKDLDIKKEEYRYKLKKINNSDEFKTECENVRKYIKDKKIKAEKCIEIINNKIEIFKDYVEHSDSIVSTINSSQHYAIEELELKPIIERSRDILKTVLDDKNTEYLGLTKRNKILRESIDLKLSDISTLNDLDNIKLKMDYITIKEIKNGEHDDLIKYMNKSPAKIQKILSKTSDSDIEHLVAHLALKKKIEMTNDYIIDLEQALEGNYNVNTDELKPIINEIQTATSHIENLPDFDLNTTSVMSIEAKMPILSDLKALDIEFIKKLDLNNLDFENLDLNNLGSKKI
ncbi:MAG: hypothetical protein K0B02_02870 [DPANN group archaeon]|nr:hypothetical protein [DPANN group archaeon]